MYLFHAVNKYGSPVGKRDLKKRPYRTGRQDNHATLVQPVLNGVAIGRTRVTGEAGKGQDLGKRNGQRLQEECRFTFSSARVSRTFGDYLRCAAERLRLVSNRKILSFFKIWLSNFLLAGSGDEFRPR